jgi:hypothetical protein
VDDKGLFVYCFLVYASSFFSCGPQHIEEYSRIKKTSKENAAHRASDNPVKVVSPEDNTGSGVSGLVLNTETRPLCVVSACRDGGDEEGENVHHGVDLAGDAHVEKDNRADEHAEEADQEKVANRVGVVIGEGYCGGVLILQVHNKNIMTLNLAHMILCLLTIYKPASCCPSQTQ